MNSSFLKLLSCDSPSEQSQGLNDQAGKQMWKESLACVFSFKWNANLAMLLLDPVDAIAVGTEQKFVKGYGIYC